MGACSAAVSEQRRNQVERDMDKGPMQILESEDYRLEPHPRQKPGSHRRQLPPPPKLFWREICYHEQQENDIHEPFKQRRMLDKDRGMINRNVSSRSARR